ncbi:phosphotransferase [Kribbella sp. CA-253562]|uniref:phosphotransferase n=1 Tax=Kribbella sp. CA-253562 TaxID=3239942 RepID=UPI003D918216
MTSLTARQRELLDQWLPEARIVRDLSWGLVGTTVLLLDHQGQRFVAKAGDEKDTHLARELQAHRDWLEPWTSINRAPELVHGDTDAKLLVTRYLPGELVEGTDHERRPETYRQAGHLLALLHEQFAIEDQDYEANEQVKSLDWLAKPHRIPPATVQKLRAEVESWPTPPSMLVPTHGDWQPRNWLIHEGTVSAIDFGRAGLRPVWMDFGRLAAQQFRLDPALEAAFLDGYGGDPRDPTAWHRLYVRDAISTTVWAYQVGAEAYEQQGHRMIAEVLDALART